MWWKLNPTNVLFIALSAHMLKKSKGRQFVGNLYSNPSNFSDLMGVSNIPHKRKKARYFNNKKAVSAVEWMC